MSPPGPYDQPKLLAKGVGSDSFLPKKELKGHNGRADPLRISGSSQQTYVVPKHKCRYLCARAQFSMREQLWEHYRTKHAFCEDCKVPLKNQRGLEQHRRQSQKHWGDDILTKIQEYRRGCFAGGLEDLVRDLKRLVVEVESNTCRDCVPPKSFVDQNQFEQHQITHHPREISCPLCPRTFASYSALVLHLETAYNCGFGDFGLTFDKTESKPKASRFYRLFREDGWYQCPTCTVERDRLSSVLQHVEATGCSRDEMMMGMHKFLNRLHDAADEGSLY
ncbi:hypothetical protein DL96DRAFT_105760 [Flagelloscypha sp. PMI_526]|nr:hypothetical protein DL96DRAFT_105760 [Flagelloscypha sp. PMI_526]